MQPNVMIRGALVVVAAAVGVSPLVSDGLYAQGRNRQSVLVLPPLPESEEDSAYAIQLGDAIRKRMDGKMRLKLRIVAKDQISEALASSGFSPDALLDANGASQLATFMNTDAYIEGRLSRNSASQIMLHLVDQRSSGLSGWLSVDPQPGLTTEKLVNVIVDSLDSQVKAAEHARDCVERRVRRELGSARDRAERAFRMYPNHPSSAVCAAEVFQMTQQADSQVAMLERAVAGDSLLGRAWEQLGRLYQTRGDTLLAAEAFAKNVAANPTDLRRRLSVAVMFFQAKDYERTIGLLDEGLARSPGDMTSLQLKERACLENKSWACARDALVVQYDVDSSLVGDTIFYSKIVGVVQALSDSAALLEWSGEAAEHAPSSVPFWRAHAGALRQAGLRDSARIAYLRVSSLDPQDVASPLTAAQIILEDLVIDSVAPLDTTAIATADSLLTRVTQISDDEGLSMNVAVLYLQPATKLVQARIQPELAIMLLDKSLTHDVQGQLTTQANFFKGLSYLFVLGTKDAQTKECGPLRELQGLVSNAKNAMTAGASVQPETANQVLGNLARYEEFLPQALTAYKCS